MSPMVTGIIAAGRNCVFSNVGGGGGGGEREIFCYLSTPTVLIMSPNVHHDIPPRY